MDTAESSAPHPHPSTEDHDDTVEAHYACLERPCACYSGWVFVGYIDEHGEEREVSYPCRRCADSLYPHPDSLCSYLQRGCHHRPDSASACTIPEIKK